MNDELNTRERKSPEIHKLQNKMWWLRSFDVAKVDLDAKLTGNEIHVFGVNFLG